MNENETTQVEATENTEDLETTTPEEVAELLNLPVPEKQEETAEESDEEAENSEESTESEEEDTETEEESGDEEESTEQEQEEQGETPTFELEVEDANGEKFVLKPGDDLEKVLKDFEPKSNGQIFAVLKQLSDLENQKSEYEAEQANKAEEADKQERIANIQKGWDAEIKALQGTKRIEVGANGKSERVDKVFEFMNKENDKRMQDGRPLIQSFEDALDKLELSELRADEAKKAKEAKETARKNGGKVGGASAPATAGTPVYKGGARNASDALRGMGILQ